MCSDPVFEFGVKEDHFRTNPQQDLRFSIQQHRRHQDGVVEFKGIGRYKIKEGEAIIRTEGQQFLFCGSQADSGYCTAAIEKAPFVISR